MTHAEAFAINEWLSDYPAFMTYDEIMDMLIGDDDEWTHEAITPWQVVEHFTLRQVAEFIDNTRAHFENTMAAMKAEGVSA
jgi:hypothetical protein